jgi:predicted phosphate transport protein (TIGR00153 family)
MPKFSLIPREMKFFDLFEKSTENLVAAAAKLTDLMQDFCDVETKVKAIKDLEHRGDALTHEIVHNLHRTFVTPIDREDIARLANSLDDVMDFIDAAARSCLIYHVDMPTDKAKRLAQLVLLVTQKLNDVMPYIHNHDKFKDVLEACVEVNRLENEADEIHNSALADLFDDKTDVLNLIKWRDIYKHIESATDRAEDVANVLEGIVLKYT